MSRPISVPHPADIRPDDCVVSHRDLGALVKAPFADALMGIQKRKQSPAAAAQPSFREAAMPIRSA